MNDKELADKIVALGVGQHPVMFNGEMFEERRDLYTLMSSPRRYAAENFVRDWRVVGALMEKCQKVYAEYIGEPEQVVYARAENNRTWEWPTGESLPRTINEACVEALT